MRFRTFAGSVLFIALLSGNSRADGLPPIEETCNLIPFGISEEELDFLMLPYQEIYTGHGQWRRYTDGKTTISVNFDMRTWRVSDRSEFRLVFDGQQARWVDVSILVIRPAKKANRRR
jgi:hypothetical protein